MTSLHASLCGTEALFQPRRNSFQKEASCHTPALCFLTSNSFDSTLSNRFPLVGPVLPVASGIELRAVCFSVGKWAALIWQKKKPFSCCSAELPYTRSWKTVLFQSGQSSSGRRGKLKGIWEEMRENVIRSLKLILQRVVITDVVKWVICWFDGFRIKLPETTIIWEQTFVSILTKTVSSKVEAGSEENRATG